MDSRIDFSYRLKSERQRLRLTQASVANTTGISKQTLIAYESGTSCPSIEYLWKLEALGFDIQFVSFGATELEGHVNNHNWLLTSEIMDFIHEYMQKQPCQISIKKRAEILKGAYAISVKYGEDEATGQLARMLTLVA